MFNRLPMIGYLLLTATILFGFGSTANALDTDLVSILTKSLGVTKQQAEGGSGAMFKEASRNMSAEDFAKVTDALPEVNALMKAAPTSDSGTMGGLSSTLGKAGGSISSIAGLTSAFSKLGLSADMVQKFTPIVLKYAQSMGGDTVANLLKSVF